MIKYNISDEFHIFWISPLLISMLSHSDWSPISLLILNFPKDYFYLFRPEVSFLFEVPYLALLVPQKFLNFSNSVTTV